MEFIGVYFGSFIKTGEKQHFEIQRLVLLLLFLYYFEGVLLKSI